MSADERVECPETQVHLGNCQEAVTAGVEEYVRESRSQYVMSHGIINDLFPFFILYSFLQPPKPLSSLSTLRDGNWRDGCY